MCWKGRRAPDSQLLVLGMRLGALLLWNSMSIAEGSRLVLFDPVMSGREYLTSARAMHRAMLRSLRGLSGGGRVRLRAGTEELLGATYSAATLDHLARLTIEPRQTGRPLSVDLITTASFRHREISHLPNKREVSFDCRWNDVASLDDTVPDVGISAALVELIEERSRA